VYDPNALVGFAAPTKDDGQDAENPVGLMRLNVNRSDRRRLLGNVYADLTLVDGLTYRLNVGVDDIVGNTSTFTPTYQMGQLANPRLSVSEFNATETSLLYEHTLTFSRSLGKHHLTVLAGYTEQSSTRRGFFGNGQATPSNDIAVLDATTLSKNTGGNKHRRQPHRVGAAFAAGPRQLQLRRQVPTHGERTPRRVEPLCAYPPLGHVSFGLAGLAPERRNLYAEPAVPDRPESTGQLRPGGQPGNR
jgi:hypothetical protein